MAEIRIFMRKGGRQPNGRDGRGRGKQEASRVFSRRKRLAGVQEIAKE
jgi:hypothetical protein